VTGLPRAPPPVTAVPATTAAAVTDEIVSMPAYTPFADYPIAMIDDGGDDYPLIDGGGDYPISMVTNGHDDDDDQEVVSTSFEGPWLSPPVQLDVVDELGSEQTDLDEVSFDVYTAVQEILANVLAQIPL